MLSFHQLLGESEKGKIRKGITKLIFLEKREIIEREN